MAQAEPLLERHSELATLDESISSAAGGQGRLVVIEGPAGIGKTSLLAETRRRAAAGGMTVVSARGAALEQEFGFGVARQLFEPSFAGDAAADSRLLLAGAAALAAPVVAPGDVGATDGSVAGQPAVVHGLYWLTANLADRTPVLVAVDDAQLCDGPSLQFLVYLARRLEGMAVLVVVTLRTGDPGAGAPMMAELVGAAASDVIHPAPLSIGGVGELVRQRLGATADASFIEACRSATGGVPFLVGELLGALRTDRVQPTGTAAARVARMGPPTVARATLLRLSRLSPAATAVARAASVLDRQSRLDRLGALAGLDPEEARKAVDALARMEILTSGSPPVFTHSLVRQAIYDDLPPGERADAHGRAARILGDEPAHVDEAAMHLLLSQPLGRDDVVETLRRAAAGALAWGAPESAVVCLRRAVSEGAPASDAGALLHELGSAEAVAQDPRASNTLEAALALTGDGVERARIGLELAQSRTLSAQWSRAVPLLHSALADLDGREPDLALRIETLLAATQLYDPQLFGELDDSIRHWRALAESGRPAGRALALHLACSDVSRGVERADALALVDRGLDGGRLLADEGSDCVAIAQAMNALVGLDELDLADEIIDGVVDDARRRGSVLGSVAGSLYRLWVDAPRGRLADAEALLRSVVELCLEHGLMFVLPNAFHAGVDVLVERPGLDDISGLLESVELEPAVAATAAGGWILAARGRLRYFRGEREAAIADLRAAGQTYTALRFTNPIAFPWRSWLALALGPDSAEEAVEWAEDELRDATAARLPRAQGSALRALGCVTGGEEGIETLRQSLTALEAADAPLERARSLVELGAALRRTNHRLDSRDPLRAGLELAHRCGAERLAAHALEELHASGARPRREMASGPEALTSAEARVARMAADGMTNKQIAQALFVTAKTVENQLGTTYAKLGVRSRADLRRALKHPESPD